MSVNIDEPSSWLRLGIMDPILKDIMDDSLAAFKKETRIDRIVATRDVWAPLYKKVADGSLKEHMDMVTCEELQLPRRDGGTSRTLLYKPSHATSSKPLLILIHGGGFCYGSPEMEGPNCVRAVAAYGCVALSLSYRLAPEHKFPTASNDCWDAVKWVLENSAQVGVDLGLGFVLGGTSAGGNIAVVISHTMHDHGSAPKLSGLWLNVPLLLAPEAVPLRHRSHYGSRDQNALAPILNKAFMDMYTEAYAPDDIQSHIWSPLNWPTGHEGQPPTYFQICGLDILRDEALIYERILRTEHGIPTRVDVYPGLPHMFASNFQTHPSSKKYATDSTLGIGWLLGYGKTQ
ncbi:hypothetical protein CGMCC3_g1416 [Colletotrichum fructicola]|nr:uncharacterized protein CGMCC3_g1416 [Colletotrichum fructicola]KAE9582263.1 hypothetical protein CGMCC3_g1416 [Colletotrichum fructicola]